MSGSVLLREPLGTRRAATPLRLGGVGADIAVPDAGEESLWLDWVDGQWWLRLPPGATAMLNGGVQRESLALADGDVLQLGTAQVVLSAEPALDVVHLQGNATVAPLQEEVLPGEAVVAGAREIFAADAAAGGARMPGVARRRRWRGVLLIVALALFIAAAAWLLRRPDAGSTAPRPGMLVIDTGGVDGELQIDGHPAGRVPGNAEAMAGRHELLIRAPRHIDFVGSVEVKGNGEKQPLKFALQPAYGWLVLNTSPAGAHVRVDNDDHGAAPLKLELDAGERRLSITAPGRREWNSRIVILAGQTLDLGVVDLALPAPAVAQAASAAEAPAAAADTSQQVAPPAPPPPPPARLQSPLLGTLILMPAGSFMQGSERREQGRRSNEVLHQVTLTRAFYLAEREVTNVQFRAFQAAHASGAALDKSLDLDAQSVSSVSWNDAVEFCNWLSLRESLPEAYEKRDGRWQLVKPYNHGYRLPSEAEWEYAARYVDGRQWRRYAWGDSLPPPPGAANLAGRESLPTKPGPETRTATALPDYVDDHAVVAPAGSYARTAAGLADIGGNLSEWVQDVYTSLPAATPVEDPFGPDADGPHVVRGANWRTAAIADLRLAWRGSSAGPSQTIGFRVARYVEAVP